MPKFYMILARKKINEILEFYTSFARKIPEFYIMIARKIFLPDFVCLFFVFFLGGGGRVPCPPSPTPMYIININY